MLPDPFNLLDPTHHQVVDEKMWGEDEEKPRGVDSKYEKDAPIQVRSNS